jgi:hypothetical protein
MPRGGFTPGQNESVRVHIRALLDQGETQVSLAPKLGFEGQGGLSNFLNKHNGTSYSVVERVAALRNLPVWEVLGKESPLADMEPRAIAGILAGEIGVSKRAIDDVLREPITADRRGWRALLWANRMQRRDMELLAAHETRNEAKASAPPRRTRRATG